MGNCQYFHSTQIASKNLAPFCVLYRKTGNEVVQKSYVSCELHHNQFHKCDLKSNVLSDIKNKVSIMEYLSLQFTKQK